MTASGPTTRAVSYYSAGAERVALRIEEAASNTVYYLLSDHLGSTSVIADADGNLVARQGYLPYGGQRFTQGADPNAYTAIDFTGQRLDGTGLHFYQARYYASALGRFVSADSIVPEPGNPQSLNRYAYGLNDPLRYADPTGRFTEDQIMAFFGVDSWEEVVAFFEKGGAMQGRWGWLEVLRIADEGDVVHAFQAPYFARGMTPYEDNGLPGGAFQIVGGQLFVVDAAGGRQTLTDVALSGNAYAYQHFVFGGAGWRGTIIGAERRFWHLRVENPNAIVDFLQWEHMAMFYAGGAATVAIGYVMTDLGAGMCVSLMGCLAGGPLVLGGVGAIGAGGVLMYEGTVLTRRYLEEVFEITP